MFALCTAEEATYFLSNLQANTGGKHRTHISSVYLESNIRFHGYRRLTALTAYVQLTYSS